MKNYSVTLTRGYIVSINANDEESAMRLAEFYIGNCADESGKTDREKHKFSIEDIEMTYNEAGSVEEIEG